MRKVGNPAEWFHLYGKSQWSNLFGFNVSVSCTLLPGNRRQIYLYFTFLIFVRATWGSLLTTVSAMNAYVS